MVAGYNGDPKTWYVFTDDREQLEIALRADPDVIRIQSSFMDTLLIVTIISFSQETFNRIRTNELVSSINSLPLFCH